MADLTFGKTIYADNTQYGSADNAIDDNISTIWSTGSTAFPHWITVDFGEETLTDVTGSGTASADNTQYGSANNAFDNNNATIWSTGSTAFPHWIKYDFGSSQEKTIIAYSIRCRGDSQEGNCPKDWTLQGSNNDSDWTDLDIQTDILFRLGQKLTFYTFSEGTNTTSYRYYRVLVAETKDDDTSGLCQIAEIEFSETSPNLSSNPLVNQTTLTCRNDTQAGDMVKNFLFQGSNNNNDWTTLDTQSNQIFSLGEKKTYDFTNISVYRFYRFYITATANNSTSGLCQIAELEMLSVVVVVTVTPDVLTITSAIKPTVEINSAVVPDVLTITSVINNPIFPVKGSLIAKIISVNPLIAITDTSPVQIIKIDTTDPNNLDYISVTIPNINNAKDVTIDFSGDYVYIAGNDGKVVKVEIANLINQTTFDLNDTDNFLTIEHNNNFGITYAGTDNETGELYTLDERNTFKLDSDFQALSLATFKLDSNFNIVSAFKLDSAFTALSYQTFKMGSDFKCLTRELTPITSIDDIIPINLEDFQVFIDSVELENTDLVLNSISITHSVGEESRASFKLSRKHDRLNTTLEDVSSIITNQNSVEIKIKGVTEFSGKISELDCQYQDNTEFVIVNALTTEKENKFNTITMSLPGLTSRLSLYDILIQNPRIYNPYVDPDNEDNPKKYKGIRVDLGTKIVQSLSKWTIFDGSGGIATQIREGTFNPVQNWTYFWSPTVEKLGTIGFGETSAIRFFYIGTSLAPVSEDLWKLVNAYHYKQRIFDDIETELGFYEVGEAPFKDVSVRNGKKITKPKLVDEPNGLYSIVDASYNFIEYAKDNADLEYELLKNINGDILPDTSCTFNLTIDAYLYYAISLLTQINVDNTTQSDIYKNSNGFPISVKSITITSEDRKVSIEADNQKSSKELEVINSQFPDEDDDEYNEEEQRTLISLKTDMRTRLKVE